MLSPLTTKIGLGVVTLTGLATGAYLTTRISIGDKLKKEGFYLINRDDDYKFVLFANKDKGDLKNEISEATITYNNAKHIEKIKDLCKKKTKEWFSSKEDKLFLNLKEWCTVPRIKKLGDKLGRNLHKGEDVWDAKFKQFANEPNKGVKFLAALNAHFKGTEALVAGSTKVEEKFKDWCNSGLNLNIYDTHEHMKEENIKAWCLVG